MPCSRAFPAATAPPPRPPLLRWPHDPCTASSSQQSPQCSPALGTLPVVGAEQPDPEPGVDGGGYGEVVLTWPQKDDRPGSGSGPAAGHSPVRRRPLLASCGRQQPGPPKANPGALSAGARPVPEPRGLEPLLWAQQCLGGSVQCVLKEVAKALCSWPLAHVTTGSVPISRWDLPEQ